MLRSLCFLLLCTLVAAQSDLDDLIKKLYQPPGVSTVKPGGVDLTSSKNGGQEGDCQCVPHSLLQKLRSLSLLLLRTVVTAQGEGDFEDLIAQIYKSPDAFTVKPGDLDDLIAQIYKPPGVSNVKPGSVDPTPSKNDGQVTRTEEDCQCVPYYLCKNDTIIKDITMKQGPCENYLDICCRANDILEQPIQPTPTECPLSCGKRNPEGVGFRISIDGDSEYAKYGEFPWMVAVLREEPVKGNVNKLDVYQCGGSLIHPKAVLTAAHCVTGTNLGKKYKIRAGEWDTETKLELFPHQERDVETIITHELYRSHTLYNDIALLILKEPVEFSETVDIVCLPPPKQVSNSQGCFVSGFSKDDFGKKGKFQILLTKVELPMVLHAKCEELLRKTRLGENFELHSSFVCAGGVPGRDTCNGGIGSPLVCPIPGQKDRYQQTGILAWSIGCGEGINPGVYTNIAELREWIDKQMQNQGLDLAN